jgi:hypothetical protein
VAEYRSQAELILRGLDLSPIWEEESRRLDQLFAGGAAGGGGGSDPKPVSSGTVGGRLASSSHLSQVMKTIQLKRLPSLPLPDLARRKRKRRRRIRREGDEEKAEEQEEVRANIDEEVEEEEGNSSSTDGSRSV